MTGRAPIRKLPLYLTAGISGALVMVVEILGARVIGPYFGVSLFVWTALISVTLLALAGGYAWGGRLADRKPSPDWLFGLIGAAGVWLILVPLLKGAVMTAALPLGLRGGAFVAALVLFGPALFLLGGVSPYLLRLAAAEWQHLGRTAGTLYAVSTAGSFIGAAATGFFLLGYVGVARTLQCSGAVLIAMAVIHFLTARRRTGYMLVLGLLPAFGLPESPASATTADGTRAQVIWGHDGMYGDVKVVEYRGTTMVTREMVIDGLIQGGIDLADGRSVYEYPYVIERLLRAIHPAGKTCLVVGLGAGVLPRALAAQGVATEAVDIDPAVAEAARRFFGFPGSIPVAIEDGRTFLARPGRAYDYIVLDVFNGDTTPGYLLSAEALRSLKRRLAPGGVLAINVIGTLSGTDTMLPAVVLTLREAFAGVKLYLASPDSLEGANYIVIARDESLNPAVAPDTSDIHPLAAAAAELLRQPGLTPDTREALVLTDDFNPLDVRDVAVKELARRRILESTPHALLLGGT